MMRESVVEILFYLFDGILFEENIYEADLVEIAKKLNEAGFEESNVNKAIDWFYELTKLDDCLKSSHQSFSVRIYTPYEQRMIGDEGQNFLRELLRMGVIDISLQEKIIERTLALAEPLSIDALRWVVAMVMINAGVEMTENQIAWFLPESNPTLQ